MNEFLSHIDFWIEIVRGTEIVSTLVTFHGPITFCRYVSIISFSLISKNLNFVATPALLIKQFRSFPFNLC